MTSRGFLKCTWLLFVVVLAGQLLYSTPMRGEELSDRGRVSLDFNEVDLPVFIR